MTREEYKSMRIDQERLNKYEKLEEEIQTLRHFLITKRIVGVVFNEENSFKEYRLLLRDTDEKFIHKLISDERHRLIKEQEAI